VSRFTPYVFENRARTRGLNGAREFDARQPDLRSVAWQGSVVLLAPGSFGYAVQPAGALPQALAVGAVAGGNPRTGGVFL
jgi:hypothetical protein